MTKREASILRNVQSVSVYKFASVSLCVWVCVVGCEHKVFLFDIIQAESQYAHVNEPENVIKNIYVLGTAVQNLVWDAGYKVTSNISYIITDPNSHLGFMHLECY